MAEGQRRERGMVRGRRGERKTGGDISHLKNVTRKRRKKGSLVQNEIIRIFPTPAIASTFIKPVRSRLHRRSWPECV